MKKADLTLPEIALIAGTRGMIGAGAGLKTLDDIARTVTAMSKDGIRLEIC